MTTVKGSLAIGLIAVLVVPILVASDAASDDRSISMRDLEVADREFETLEIGDKIVYFHQRKCGDAVVLGDRILYRFDKVTGELISKTVDWRDDLPDPPVQPQIAQEAAESMVEGDIRFSRLCIIPPESPVFPLDPAPENPCWVVASTVSGQMVLTVIDAVDGTVLGNGVPPPYNAFSMTGPSQENPCALGWQDWYENAATWFDAMGYNTESVEWPTTEKIKSHVQSVETALFYEAAHSRYTHGLLFTGGCNGGRYDTTTAAEIHDWIAPFTKMPFTFLASCFGMCDTGPGTLSYEFRKGSISNTATVGYCGMSDPPCLLDCFGLSIQWQDLLFEKMSLGWTVKDAFDEANLMYPECGLDNCMVFAGDPAFAVVPVVERGFTGLQCEVDISPNVLNRRSNGRWITCHIELPGGYDPADIDISTVKLNGTVAAATHPVAIGDHDGDGIPDLMVKFPRREVMDALGTGDNVQIWVICIAAGQPFIGYDSTRIFLPLVTFPAGEELFEVGDECIVRWNAPRGHDAEWYSLYYTAGDGDTWNLIAEGVAGTSWPWTVPEDAAVSCQVLVEAYDDEGIMGYDLCDRDFTVNIAAGVYPRETAPNGFAFFPIGPASVTKSTMIRFDLPEVCSVNLTIYDVRGRIVRNLMNDVREASSYLIEWDGKDLSGSVAPAGVYFARFEAGAYKVTGKIVRLH
jgi:hypothetical protein